MSTIAKLSNGSFLKIGDGIVVPPEGFTTIPEVMRLSGPAVRFDLLDVSSHDTAGLFREYIPGFSDGDVVNADINWRPSNTIHTAVRVDAYAATRRNFKIIYPDTLNSTVTFAGFVEDMTPNADVGRPLTAGLRLKVTGAPVWS